MCLDVGGVLSIAVGVLSLLVVVLVAFLAFNFFTFESKMKKRVSRELRRERKRLKCRMDGMFYLSTVVYFKSKGDNKLLFDAIIRAVENFIEGGEYDFAFHALDLVLPQNGESLTVPESEMFRFRLILHKLSDLCGEDKDYANIIDRANSAIDSRSTAPT
jgi:hypothetical protein